MKIDIGCGKNKRTDGDWTGIDEIYFEGVEVVSNIFPFLKSLENDSLEAVNMSHFLNILKSKSVFF